MNKRIIALGIALVVIISAPIFLYFYFQPKGSVGSLNVIYTAETPLSYEDFISNYKESAGSRVLFLNNEDQDSVYITNSVLKALATPEQSAIPVIQSVSIKDTKNITVTQLKDRFNVERTPSFVHIEIDSEGNVKVLSTITHYPEEPITEKSLKTWFFEQGLWNGPYDEE